MYLLQIHHNGCRHRVGGSFSMDEAHGKIAKWTCLPPHNRSRELLQLMALGTAGIRFVPYIPLETLSLFKNRTSPLQIESIHARHAPHDRLAHHSTITGAGLQLGPEGQVKQLRAGKYRFLSDEVVKASLRLSSGNTAFFLLGYAPGMQPHRGTDDFEFLNPNFRVTRIQPLFCSTSWITDPVEILGRLHYRGIQKSRFPAEHTLQKISELFAEYLDINTRTWLQRGCDLRLAWQEMKPWQQRAALPALDAARHMVDAFPRLAKPSNAPGLVLMHRPEMFCKPSLFSSWIRMMDSLFPDLQFIVTLSKRARQSVPGDVLEGRLTLPEAVIAPPVKKLPRLSSRTILLIDVDGRLPNLALMKLSRYFKEQGRRVHLARRESRVLGPERVYGSSVFYTNASSRRVQKLRNFYGDALTLGGSGVDIERRLPAEIEALQPDYELYPELGDRAIGFLTRGCPYRCRFCIVPAKEGNVHEVADFGSLLQDGRKKLILLDDNLLSHSKAGAILEEMVRRELQVNFTQTLDLRFLDKEMVQLLRRIHCSNTRFTRKNYHFSLNNARGLDRIRQNYELFGFRSSDNVEFVCMYGFNTSLREDVKRFRFLRTLPGTYVFVQEYQPTIGGPRPRLHRFFDDHTEKLIDELIGIEFPQNMKSMERYYRWLSKRYALAFGKLHSGLVDTIFRYNNRDHKGRYIARLAGTMVEHARRVNHE